MPSDDAKNGDSAGVSAESPVDVDGALPRLREEVRRSGADPGRQRATRTTGGSPARRPSGSGRCPPTARSGFVQASAAASARRSRRVLRKLMRWYVEPLAYDQRSFNAAALRLIDDLQEQVDRLQAGARRRRAPGSR